MGLSAAELGPFGQRLAERLRPWLTEDLERVCAAIGAMGFNDTLALVEEEGTEGQPRWIPPWGKLFDPDLCPARALPYLAQYVGVEIPKEVTEEEARALIKEENGTKRGTRQAVEVAVRKSLTGERQFDIIERRNANNEEDPYHFLVLAFNASELPSEATLIANVNAVKPGGVFFTVIVGATYAVLEAAHGTYGELEAAHTTYADMEAFPTK